MGNEVQGSPSLLAKYNEASGRARESTDPYVDPKL